MTSSFLKARTPGSDETMYESVYAIEHDPRAAETTASTSAITWTVGRSRRHRTPLGSPSRRDRRRRDPTRPTAVPIDVRRVFNSAARTARGRAGPARSSGTARGLHEQMGNHRLVRHADDRAAFSVRRPAVLVGAPQHQNLATDPTAAWINKPATDEATAHYFLDDTVSFRLDRLGAAFLQRPRPLTGRRPPLWVSLVPAWRPKLRRCVRDLRSSAPWRRRQSSDGTGLRPPLTTCRHD